MTPAPDQPSAGPRLAREAGRSLFGTNVSGYECGRLGYPPQLYEWLLEPIAGQSATIVEIGPGTGLATADLLAADPAQLVAVEPDPQLAEHLRRRFASTAVQVVETDFVSAPLSGPVDLVASAASFHWLEPESALRRIRKLLTPEGRLALWWNVYRQVGIGDPLADAVTPLLEGVELPPSEGPTGHYSLDAALHRRQLHDAGLAVMVDHIFRHERILATSEVLALYTSYSYVRALPADRRKTLLAAIGDLVERRFAGRAPNIVLTPLYIARIAS